MLTVPTPFPNSAIWPRPSCVTLRLRLLKIAARVIETARTVRLAFAACHPRRPSRQLGALAPLGP